MPAMATHFPSLELPHTRRAKNRLVHDLQSLVHDAERLIEATRDDLGDQARAARRQLSNAIDRVRETTGEWRDRGLDAAKSADRVVRNNPYRSLGIALGAGVAIGLLLRRRD